LQLVEAKSKVPFVEHTGPAPENLVYAEVEPDVEYFIKIISHREGLVKVNLYVDGSYLGYASYVGKESYDYDLCMKGHWKVVNGEEQMTALRFKKASTKSADLAAPTPSSQNMWTGKVEAKFYQLGKEIDDIPMEDYSSCFLDESHASNMGQKGVATTKGEFVGHKKKVSEREIIYEEGPWLASITLNYCTAAGLIARKILTPPPAASAQMRETAEGKKTTKKIKTEHIGSKSVESTLKLMEQLKSVDKQIEKLKAGTDDDLGEDLKEELLKKLKGTKVEIAKMMVAGSDKHPIKIDESDCDGE
jgi:hypothetical protein